MKFISTLFFSLFTIVSFAQYEGKVTSGIIEFDNEDYDKAVEYLSEAVANKDQLKEKTVPKAYFYLGEAHLKLAEKEASNEKFDNPNNAIHAFDAFQKVLESNDNKYIKKVNNDLPLLDNILLLHAQKSINDENYSKAQDILKASTRLNNSIETPNWVSYDFYGQILLQLKDSTEAINHFKKAIDTYKSIPSDEPDAAIAYVYLRASMLSNNLDQSLDLLEEGLAALEKEREKLSASKNVSNEYKESFLAKLYPSAKNDLERAKLNILLKNPEKLDQALNEFDSAIQKDPQNYQLWMAYAQLMEEKNVDKAAEIYIKAIKINPTEFMGHYNLAALYINEGNRMYTMANATHDKNTSTQLKKRADIYYEEGYKQLIACNTIQPSDRTVLQHLVTVSQRLDKASDHQKYSQELNKL